MTRKILQEIVFIAVRVALIVAIIYAGYSCISACYDFGYKIFADEAKDPEPGIVKTVAIVDGKTDKASPFSLSDKGSRIKVTRNNGVVYMLETEN